MAPNGGHLLVGKATRLFRFAFEKATRVLREKIPQTTQPFETQAEPVYARITTRSSHPASRVAGIRQTQSRFYSTKQTRQFSSTAQQSAKPLRSSYPPSRTGQHVSRLTSRAPFASTLRPNLTGGALGRTSGGYSVGAGRIGGRRYFSHTPASPAEVIQNVSQAVRAFWLSGQRARFDGLDEKTGSKRFRAVSELQDQARQKMNMSSARSAGSFVDFKVSPTITAIGPLAAIASCSPLSTASCDSIVPPVETNTVANLDLLTSLQVDFSRALKDLAAIMNDLKHLSTLGALPITLVDQNTLRVRFAGCDRDTVENLCRELNVRRGIVGQDEDFDEKCGADMALLFPFAPSRGTSEMDVVFENENSRPKKRMKKQRMEWEDMVSYPDVVSYSSSQRLVQSHDILDDAEMVENPWLSSPSGYSSLHASDDGHLASMFEPPSHSKQFAATKSRATEYEGVEGIYKFLEQCERAQR